MNSSHFSLQKGEDDSTNLTRMQLPKVSAVPVHSYRQQNHPRPQHNNSNSYFKSRNSGVTVVTAYFNLGRFQKGEDGSTFFEPNLYMHWLKLFSKIQNPVVAYFDTRQAYDYFKSIRSNFPSNRTKIVLISRNELWSFGLYDKMMKIFSQPEYPRFEPNTVMPEYGSVMHAKYELMHRTILDNTFNTRYFCWLDVGLFRGLAKRSVPEFYLATPPDFNNSSIAYTEVYAPFPHKISLEQIFFTNLVWLCGCFFIGEETVMLTWTEEYMKYTDYFLEQGFANTDQQVLYAMFNRGKPKTNIQTYRSTGKYNQWFHLGYLCREASISE